MALRIRTGVGADIPALIELRGSVLENRLSDPKAVTPADYQAHIARGDLFVGQEDGEIRGFSAGDRETGWIWALFVRPGHEGRGIGRALFAAACEALRRAGHTRFTLSTDLETRAAAFYRRAGWRESGRTAKGDLIFTHAEEQAKSPESQDESAKNPAG